MKKLLLITLSLILFNCSSDDETTNNPPETENNEIFAYKGDDAINTTYIPRIVKINPNNGNETDIAFTETGLYLYGFVFNKATNDILALDDNQLHKININNGSHSITDLDNSNPYIGYDDLIIDNSNNVYAFKTEDNPSGTNTYVSKIVKINPNNGTETEIASTEVGLHLYGFVFNNETNEILALDHTDNGSKLYKISLGNSTYSVIDLDNSNPYIGYDDLIIDDENNLYGFKTEDNPSGTNTYVSRIVKINPNNGTEIEIASTEVGLHLYGFVFNNETNEILGLDDNKLFKISVSNGTVSTVNLDNSTNEIFYEDLIIK